VQQHGDGWVQSQNQACRVSRPEALNALFAHNLACDIPYAGWWRDASRSILLHHGRRLFSRHDLLEGRRPELGEGTCYRAHANLFKNWKASAAVARCEPPLSDIGICQEEQEAVCHALDDRGDQTAVEGLESSFALIYCFDRIKYARVMCVLSIALQLPLRL
jgi:hypothetical protein